MTTLDLPPRSEALARRIVELRRHWETKSPAWVKLPDDCTGRIQYVGHDTVTVALGLGHVDTFPALDCEVVP